jgi:hypothetical protein
MRYLTINNEQFPYENAQYSDVDSRITGRHLVHCFMQDVPAAIRQKIADTKLLDIRDMAEAKVLVQYPEYEEFTSYGTRKKGYYKLLNEQIRKTMYWTLNKQPASFTMITNQISGLSRKADDITDPDTVFGKIQLCLQLGTTVQIVIPESGYSCIIQPVCNKKKMELFTKHFMVEKYIEQYEAGTLQDTDVLAHMDEVYAKYNRLEEYRQTVQKEIWDRVNEAIAPYRDEWKCENIYSLPTRMAFAINAQTEDILNKYNADFRIPAANALTLEDLNNPKVFDEMIRIISEYGSAFGISVKVSESESDTMTYIPHEWLRDDKGTITKAVMLKRASMVQQSLRKAPLNELLQAYIQIDWYMSQEHPEEFYVTGYGKCECGRPIRQMVTHYYNVDTNELYDMDKHTNYNYKYNEYADIVEPVTVCPHCGRILDAGEFELGECISYEILSYKLDRDEQ